MRPFYPPVSPEDLGIKLDEDSENFLDAAEAIETEDAEDFVRLASNFIREKGAPTVRHSLLRKAGILFCRVHVEGGGVNESRVFRLPWLRE
jgi:hypothetical protein